MDTTRDKSTFILKTLLVSFLTVALCTFALGQEKYTVTAPKLNVRKGPSSQSAIIGSLSKGDTIIVNSLKKSWAQIDFKKGIGYVALRYIQPIQEDTTNVQEPETIANDSIGIQDNQALVKPRNSHEKKRFFRQFHFRLTSTVSLGLSDFYSFDAYSHPRFGFGLDAGTQISSDFMPKNMFSEITIGYMSLGNSNYSFPSFSVNILPVGYRSEPVHLWKLQNARYYAVGGLSLQFSGGGIFFSRKSQYYSFYSKPTVNFYAKGGLELTDMIAVGFLYMHGFDNVCSNLPIGIKHSVFQIYGSFLFDKWKKQ